MKPLPPELTGLETEAYRIVGMICSESVPPGRLDASIDALRSRTLAAFPDRPELFDRTYGRRFRRLRSRFRPGAGLLTE